MIRSMIFFIITVIFFVFVFVAKKYSLRCGKSIQNTVKEIFYRKEKGKEKRE